MKLADIVQKKGIEKSEQKPLAAASSAPRRRYFWDEEENQTTKPKEPVAPEVQAPEIKHLKAQEPVRSPLDESKKASESSTLTLDSRLIANSSALDNALISRESGVRSPLEIKSKKIEPVRQPLATALDVRESGVRKTENSALDIGFLVGKEKFLVFLVCDQCKKIGSLETNYLSTDDLKLKLSIDSNGLRNLIHRLKGKGFFEVEAKQLGRNGLRKFKILQTVYQQFLISPLDSRESGVSSAVVQALGTALEEPPCSSSNLNINNTTTTEPDLWLSVPKNLEGRVSIRQLRDFVKQDLISAEDLQSSLDGFAYDLEKGSIRAKNGNPVAILIGAVKSGGYISQSYLSELKASLADVAKAREELQQIQAANNTQQLQEEFESFRAKFPDQAEQIKPSSKYLTNFELGSVGYKMWLEEYKKSQGMEPNVEAAEA